MHEFWLDTDSLVTPNRGPYRFATLPTFWEFLAQKASEQIIGSSEFVLQELIGGGDQLEVWAKEQRGILFLAPDELVQATYSQIVQNVQNNQRYAAQHVSRFLSGADPWIIAHAATSGGRIVTFEKSEPNSTRPKIPDVAAEFGVTCINIYDVLTELGASL